MATVVSETRSPVQRRSLIDATDKPLRRSMSPSRTTKRDEEWPALQPSQSNSKEVLPSTDPENSTATESQARPDTPSGSASDHKRSSLGPVRQMKTSTMRAQRAFEGSQFRNRQTSAAVSALDNSRPSSAASSRSDTPTFDTFRGLRQGVTTKGSPYTLKISDHAVKDVPLPTIKPDAVSIAASRRRPTSSGSFGSESLSELVAVKGNRPNLKRNRSIMETLQADRADMHPDSEADVQPITSSKRSKVVVDEGHTSDADIDTDIDKTAKAVAELAIDENKSANAKGLVEKGPAKTANEILKDGDLTDGNPAPDMTFIENMPEDEAIDDHPDMDSPGYIVRRLSKAAPDYGPTLRISGAAEKILMGPDTPPAPVPRLRDSVRRNSAPNLRRSLIIKEALKQSKDSIIDNLSLRRSSTAFSLSKAGLEDDDDSLSMLANPATPFSPNQSYADEAKNEEFSPVSQDTSAFHNHTGALSGRKMSEEWPLKPNLFTTPAMASIRAYLADTEDSWISPLSAQEPPKTSQLGIETPTPLPPEASRISYPPRTSSRIPIASSPMTVINNSTGLRKASIPNRFQSPNVRRTASSQGKHTPYSNGSFRSRAERETPVATPLAKKSVPGGASSARGVLSNFRGLFHKHSMDSPGIHSEAKSSKHSFRKGTFGRSSTKKKPVSGVSISPPLGGPRLVPVSEVQNAKSVSVVSTPANIAQASPHQVPVEAFNDDTTTRANDLAHRVIDLASAEPNSHKQKQYIDIARALAESIEAANEAEQAHERAKMFAAKAEMCVVNAKRALSSILGEVALVLQANEPATRQKE